MRSFSPAETALARLLFDLGAVKFGAFRLKLHDTDPSAPLSPIYLNLRTADNPKPGPLTRQALEMIGELLYELACRSGLQYSHAAGIPNAGDPLAEAFRQAAMRERGIPLIRLGKTDGTEGRKVVGIIAGDHDQDDRVLLIDDLITHADSKFEAIRVLEEAGLRVPEVLVLVDRGQGGFEELMRAGYRLHAVFTLVDLLDFYLQERLIDQTKHDEVIAYLAANG